MYTKVIWTLSIKAIHSGDSGVRLPALPWSIWNWLTDSLQRHMLTEKKNKKTKTNPQPKSLNYGWVFFMVFFFNFLIYVGVKSVNNVVIV